MVVFRLKKPLGRKLILYTLQKKKKGKLWGYDEAKELGLGAINCGPVTRQHVKGTNGREGLF